MSDPYMLGFYVGMATATVIELGSMFLLLKVIQARKARQKPLRTCKSCDAEIDERGHARDSLFKLYVCPTCMDTVPRRFAKPGAIPTSELVVPADGIHECASCGSKFTESYASQFCGPV